MLAAVAITLSVIGIHAVMSWTVNDRMQEIGIRMAVGAGPAEVRRMIVGRGLTLAMAGVVVGVARAAPPRPLLSDFLVGVKPTDTATHLSVPAILLITAALSSWAPAQRASRVTPLEALRTD